MIDGFEIEFLTVGDTGRSGDCILVRYREDGEYKILAYDGGVKSSGEAMVRHIQKYYQTDTIDFLVNSHPIVPDWPRGVKMRNGKDQRLPWPRTVH